MVYSLVFLGFMSFIVWAHHMFFTGMGTTMAAFFQATTMIISIPSVAILTALVISLWGGSIRFTTPMLFALAFLPMFGIGGLTGLPLGLAATTSPPRHLLRHRALPLRGGAGHDLRALRRHLLLVPQGDRPQDERDARQAPLLASLVFMNGIFMPMFIQGLAGVSRRLYDGGATYDFAQPFCLERLLSFSAWGLALAQIPFIVNFFWSIRHGEKVGDNPWEATTLEWAAPSPPPHGNFPTPPAAHRGPYEYSVPGAASDYTPQWASEEPDRHGDPVHRRRGPTPASTTARSASGSSSPPR
jgi:cytochrome c oxidase subunit I